MTGEFDYAAQTIGALPAGVISTADLTATAHSAAVTVTPAVALTETSSAFGIALDSALAAVIPVATTAVAVNGAAPAA